MKHKEAQLQNLIKAIKENEDIKKTKEVQHDSDNSENIENDDIQERTLDELINLIEKDVPFKNKPYIKTAIFEFIKERKDYDSKFTSFYLFRMGS